MHSLEPAPFSAALRPAPVLPDVQPVAGSPDRLDNLRVPGIILDLLADAVHMDHNRRAVAHVIDAPDLLIELLLGEDDVRI